MYYNQIFSISILFTLLPWLCRFFLDIWLSFIFWITFYICLSFMFQYILLPWGDWVVVGTRAVFSFFFSFSGGFTAFSLHFRFCKSFKLTQDRNTTFFWREYTFSVNDVCPAQPHDTRFVFSPSVLHNCSLIHHF